MKSIRELLKKGNGPSSSHTMGPKKAAEIIRKRNNDADEFKVILYGSLAATGKGHLTDYIIEKTLEPIKTEIVFDTETQCDVHPNTLDLYAYKEGREIDSLRVYSVGGGSIKIEGEKVEQEQELYELETFEDIKNYCEKNNMKLYEYVYENEDENFKEYLKDIWVTMENGIKIGLNSEGILPGKLHIKKRAKNIYNNRNENETEDLKRARLLTAYAYATSENNSSGEIIVTAPTCGACGVLPAVLHYLKEKNNYTEEEIINALATGGLIGNIVKTQASISGAECGCQAEVGTACSMAAAACAELYGLEIYKIGSAAEIAMEHHLGLTCDPILGYVQIPCIERNSVAAMRAIDSCNLASILNEPQKISFDMVVETMYETGKDLSKHYRETSEGGLAKKYCRNKFFNKDMEEE